MMLHPDYATIELRRCYVPNCIVPHDPQPMISVCTVTVEGLSRRTLMGEEEWDVIEEYTSWIWFFDRDGFRAASHLARCILRLGEILYGVSAREPTKCGIDGEPGKLVVSLSAHHTEGGQRNAPSDERRNCRCAVEEAGISPASVQPARMQPAQCPLRADLQVLATRLEAVERRHPLPPNSLSFSRSGPRFR